MRRMRWLVATLVAVALLVLTAGPASATNSELSKRSGDFLYRQAKIWIVATNTNFTAMNWTKARAQMGGSLYWDRKRRDIAGWWLYSGRTINRLSTAERRNIVDHHWPDPPSCDSCASGQSESQRLYVEAGYRYTEAVFRAVQRETQGTADLIDPRGMAAGHNITPATCTGVTRTDRYGETGWDNYYDSCETNRKVRFLTYTQAACVVVFGDGSLRSAAQAMKRVREDKGLSAAAAILGMVCSLSATKEKEDILGAQDRSGVDAVIHKVRRMSYTSYPTGHWLTNTTWEPQ